MGNEMMGRNMNSKTIERFLEDANRCSNIIIISMTTIDGVNKVVDSMAGIISNVGVTYGDHDDSIMMEIDMYKCSREIFLPDKECIVSHCTDEDGDEQYMFSYERHCIEITLWNNYME